MEGSRPAITFILRKMISRNIATDDIKKIRNNKPYVLARKLFDSAAVGDLNTDLIHTCLKCEKVHQQKHLKEYLQLNPNDEKPSNGWPLI